jgi:hypothetical protein
MDAAMLTRKIILRKSLQLLTLTALITGFALPASGHKVEQKFTEEQRRIFKNPQRPQQQPLQQSGGDGEMDEHGRSPGHPHYGHSHP